MVIRFSFSLGYCGAGWQTTSPIDIKSWDIEMGIIGLLERIGVAAAAIVVLAVLVAGYFLLRRL